MPLNNEEKTLLNKALSELSFPGNFRGGVFEAYQFGRAQVLDMLARIELVGKAPQTPPPNQTSKKKKKKRKAK